MIECRSDWDGTNQVKADRRKQKSPDNSCQGIRDWSERRDLNPRPFAPEANAKTIEL